MDAVFREAVHDFRDRGRTLFLASHILSEVEALADRVSIIRDGKTVDVGSLEQMRHLARISITANVARGASAMAKLKGVHHFRTQGDRVEFDVDPDELSGALAALAKSGATSLTSHPPTLEEIFLRHYSDERTARESKAPVAL